MLFPGNNTLTLLTSAELSALAATAPSHIDTRSSSALSSDRRLTESELNVWIEEFRALGGISYFELEVIRLINEYRVSYGLNPLAISMELSMAARFHSQEMADLGFFSHTSPIYGSGLMRVELFGHVNTVPGRYGARENLSGFQGPQRAPYQPVEGWLNSLGHRSALLDESAVSIGVGTVQGGGITAKFGF